MMMAGVFGVFVIVVIIIVIVAANGVYFVVFWVRIDCYSTPETVIVTKSKADKPYWSSKYPDRILKWLSIEDVLVAVDFLSVFD